MTLLKRVVERCSLDGERLPITPIQETRDSVGFWNLLRDDPRPGLLVWPELQMHEMAGEAGYWCDMAASAAEVSRFVRYQVQCPHGADYAHPDGSAIRYGEYRHFLEWLDKAICDPARER